jgi:hypothetical protein
MVMRVATERWVRPADVGAACAASGVEPPSRLPVTPCGLVLDPHMAGSHLDRCQNVGL